MEFLEASLSSSSAPAHSRHLVIVCQDNDARTEAERFQLDDVRGSINDLVQLIQTYKNNNKLVKIVTSSLFEQRQREVEAVIDSALTRLQVILSLGKICTPRTVTILCWNS